MSRPIFFTHVMKTGGTSLGQTVERAVGNEPKFPHDAPSISPRRRRCPTIS
jgi:hypothetical protein